MDRVELVYRVEEEFELKMSDEDAEQITTPRQLIDYLMGRPEVSPKWSRDYVALSVWRMVEDELGIDRDAFNEDSRFIEDMGAE
jgi:acyl carrier protein